MRATGVFSASLLAAYATTCAAVAAVQPPKPPKQGATPVDFNRDIRPLLSENCFSCHGPDPAKRQAGLRLDRREDLFNSRGGGVPVAPGNPAKSQLWLRVTSSDSSLQMPPPASGKSLTARQKELIRRWIAEGGRWAQHWAFVAPVRPPLPPVRSANWVRNPIDRFVLARLEKERLTPSPEADRITLLRRLSLDLIGLPPTPAEVDAFLADRRPDAYQRQVERLLASPHYGERWGRQWLDGARYADSDGFEKDKPRSVWFYRDWVVNAFNQDLPYDRFVIDQLAGDLEVNEQLQKQGDGKKPSSKTISSSPHLPIPSRALPFQQQQQVVATGFLRNSMLNEEGGVDPEQFRMEAMFDRMDAVGKSMLGLTIQCAQCHTHKFDPITHDDYYRLFAFLNNAHEANVAVYSPSDDLKRAEIFRRTREIETQLQHENPDWSQRLATWEQQVRGDQPEWRVLKPELDGSGGQKLLPQSDGSILAQGYAPVKEVTDLTVKVDTRPIAALRLEALNDPNLPCGGPGRSPFGLFGLTEFRVTVAPADKPDAKQTVKIAAATADVNPSEQEVPAYHDDRTKRRRVTGPIEFALDGKDETAWGIDIGPGRSNVPRKAVFVFEKLISFPQGAILTIRLEQRHGGWNNNDNQNNNLGRYRLSATGATNATADPLPLGVREIFALPTERRTTAQTSALFSYWRTTRPEWRAANEQIEQLWRSHPQPSTQFVLEERTAARPTYLLERGNFLKPAQQVQPGVPAFLHPLPPNAPPNRLTFARWLVDRRSPTAARSIVNRIWQSYFGLGIVRTSEDFGFQSEVPSHPELLDWLATSLMSGEWQDNKANTLSPPTSPPSTSRRPWSLKALHRAIVTSATYRQSSAVTPERLARDPENRLLSRGARFRVDGELVRDIALSASGLLNPKIGGPSVYPPAPEFLFLPPASYGPKIWPVATGPDRYRRGLYTFRFRSVPYPAFQAFDAPNGDASCVRRTRSNTPLQALTTLNEPLFVESAQALAAKTLREGGATDEARLTYAFRRCVARKPTPQETAVLLDLLKRQSGRLFLARSGAAEGAAPVDAWTVIARVLLNLDETITRE